MFQFRCESLFGLRVIFHLSFFPCTIKHGIFTLLIFYFETVISINTVKLILPAWACFLLLMVVHVTHYCTHTHSHLFTNHFLITFILHLCLSALCDLSPSFFLFSGFFFNVVYSPFHQFLCTVVAILLHYFFMCTFAWMFVEGLHIYRMQTEQRNINFGAMRFYYAIGWGVPAIITGNKYMRTHISAPYVRKMPVHQHMSHVCALSVQTRIFTVKISYLINTSFKVASVAF